MQSIDSSAFKNIAWVSLGKVSLFVSGLLSTIFLGRLISPSDFGIIAIVKVFVAFLEILRESGFSSALIQHKNTPLRLYSSVFSLYLITGLVIPAITGALLFVYSAYAHVEALEMALFVSSFVPLINSFGAVNYISLEKSQQFDKILIIDCGSSLLSFVPAYIIALNGYGVLALLVQFIFKFIIRSIFSKFLKPMKLSFCLDLKKIATIWKFSRDNLLVSGLVFSNRNTDSLIIERFIGTSYLGIYSMAYNLSLNPLAMLSSTFAKSLYPLYTNLRSRRDDLLNHYVRVLYYQSTISAIIACPLWLFRERIILFVLGERWHLVSDALAWLLPAAYIRTTMGLSSTILNTQSLTSLNKNYALFSVPYFIVLYAIGALNGFNIFCIVYFVSYLLWAVYVNLTTFRALGLRTRRLYSLGLYHMLWWLSFGSIRIFITS